MAPAAGERLWQDVADASATALVTLDEQLSWGALRERAARLPVGGGRVDVTGDASVAAVERTLAALHHGATPVLAHPKWPARMRAAALERAAAGRALSAEQQRATAGDLATIVFTSGTSGTPRPVLHTIGAHRAAAAGAARRMPFGPGDRWLLSLPICHVGGLAVVFRALLGGGALAIPPQGMPIGDAIQALAPTHVSLVTAQLRALLASREATEALGRVRVILVGGGPTPGALFAEALARGLPVRQTWGLTEMGGQVCTSEAGAPATCGPPLPGRCLRVAADGELIVDGAGCIAGIVDGDAVWLPVDRDGGFATNDLGELTPAGLVVIGRKDARFVCGGENIQPEAVAAALADPAVLTVVVPVADQRFGHRPYCFFDADDPDDDAVIRRLRARADDALPRFMHPAGYARLPDTAGQKVSRAALLARVARWRGAPH